MNRPEPGRPLATRPSAQEVFEVKRTLIAAAAFLAAFQASAVTLAFEVPTQHSDWWKSWAFCGDYPWLVTPENLNPELVGSISFDEAKIGQFRPSDFTFSSNETDGRTGWVALVYGSPGFVYIELNAGPEWRPEAIRLALPVAVAAPVPEPAPLLLTGLGLVGLLARSWRPAVAL